MTSLKCLHLVAGISVLCYKMFTRISMVLTNSSQFQFIKTGRYKEPTCSLKQVSPPGITRKSKEQISEFERRKKGQNPINATASCALNAAAWTTMLNLKKLEVSSCWKHLITTDHFLQLLLLFVSLIFSSVSGLYASHASAHAISLLLSMMGKKTSSFSNFLRESMIVNFLCQLGWKWHPDIWSDSF